METTEPKINNAAEEPKTDEKEKQTVKAACCNCLYFEPVKDVEIEGSCMVDPPKMFLIQQKGNVSLMGKQNESANVECLIPRVLFYRYCKNFIGVRDEFDRRTKAIEEQKNKKPSLVQ